MVVKRARKSIRAAARRDERRPAVSYSSVFSSPASDAEQHLAVEPESAHDSPRTPPEHRKTWPRAAPTYSAGTWNPRRNLPTSVSRPMARAPVRIGLRPDRDVARPGSVGCPLATGAPRPIRRNLQHGGQMRESRRRARSGEANGLPWRIYSPQRRGSPVKFIPSQLAYLTTDREARGNLRALAKYLAFPDGAGDALCRPVSRHQAERRARAALVGHRPLLDARRDDDAGVRRHHVHQRHRPRLQHRRAALRRRVPPGDAAVPVHSAVLRAVARGARAAARAAGSAGRDARARHHRGVRRDRGGTDRAVWRPKRSPTSSSSRTRPRRPAVRRPRLRCWPARTTTA